MATISTHNGSAVRRQHNIRNKKVTSKQLHIDPGGEHEIWKDETIAHAYHRIFDKYVEEYNSRHPFFPQAHSLPFGSTVK